MVEFLRTPFAELVLWLAGGAALIAIATFVVGRVREYLRDETTSANEHLAKFREMHSAGVLSDEEFRTIKTSLTEQVHSEIRDSHEMG